MRLDPGYNKTYIVTRAFRVVDGMLKPGDILRPVDIKDWPAGNLMALRNTLMIEEASEAVLAVHDEPKADTKLSLFD